jgi:hypothetical protein
MRKGNYLKKDKAGLTLAALPFQKRLPKAVF